MSQYRGYIAWSSFEREERYRMEELHLDIWHYFLDEVLENPFSTSKAKKLKIEFPEAVGIVKYGQNVRVFIIRSSLHGNP